jgi:hypothetical protein
MVAATSGANRPESAKYACSRISGYARWSVLNGSNIKNLTLKSEKATTNMAIQAPRTDRAYQRVNRNTPNS